MSKSLENLSFAFTHERQSPNDVSLLGRIKSGREYRFISSKYVSLPESYTKWKVFLPEANGSGAIGEVLSTPLIGKPLIGKPLIGTTDTFLTLGAFDTEEEANNLLKYIKTRFCRVTLGILKVTQHNSRKTWKMVPLQDFTSNSDIDWSKSIPEIDQQLYQKYGLDEAEINFIETKVKEMA